MRKITVSSLNATRGVAPENEFSKTYSFLREYTSIPAVCETVIFGGLGDGERVSDLPLRIRNVRKIERQKTNSTNLSHPRIALYGFRLFRYISRVNGFASAGLVDLSTCIIYYFRHRTLYIYGNRGVPTGFFFLGTCHCISKIMRIFGNVVDPKDLSKSIH